MLRVCQSNNSGLPNEATITTTAYLVKQPSPGPSGLRVHLSWPASCIGPARLPNPQRSSLQKGVGWQRGLEHEDPFHTGDSDLLSASSRLGPVSRGDTHLWNHFWVSFSLFVSNPLLPIPFESLSLYLSIYLSIYIYIYGAWDVCYPHFRQMFHM